MTQNRIALLLVPALMLAALPLVGNLPAWVTLTVAGLAMGMIIFVIASGLTLVFGLMDVLKFGHGAVIATGAYVAAAVMLSPEDFDRLTTQARFVAAVQDGLGDLDAGRVVSDEDLGRRLDARFGAVGKPTKKK